MIREKLRKTLFDKKADHKMLVKLATGEKITYKFHSYIIFLSISAVTNLFQLTHPKQK